MRTSTMAPDGARLKKTAGRVLAVLFALLLWQIAAELIDLRIVLVTPVEVLRRMCTIWREPGFFETLWFSFRHIAAGFFLGLILGSAFAALAGRFSWIETLLWPFMVTVKTVPVASFIVICLIWLRTESLSVFISFLIVLPVVYGNLLEGIKSEDCGMKELAEVYHLPMPRRMIYVHLPQLKPFIFSACSTSLGMAWKAGVAAEIIGTPNGSVGKMLYYAKIYIDTDDLLCWTLVIVAVSVLFEKLFMLLLRRACRRLERA